ncbi:hypothetical protein I317_03055 [Kwoniella heveanensis CBS 569]|nr:hypothetical protein I317_03055 [Kwoniella heveanensis CBS 569]
MSLQPPPPPPRRSAPASASSSRPSTPADSTAAPGWKDKMKASGKVWGKKAMDKGIQISDNLGGKVNNIAEKRFGTEAFWPVTGDFPKEMDKCARILRAFTVDGIVTEEKGEVDPSEPDEKKKKKKTKVIRKIPPTVIAQAKGLAIFTSMRTGFAPFGGAGGAGVVVAKLPDGTWSAPASISPNNLSAGFLIGVDVYDCVLVIRTQEALDSFKTHKATIGAELGVAAGPYGAGAAVEAGMEKAPLFSYVKSRGVYAGVEIVGQVFVERFDENGAMYHWPGIKAGDILAGKVKVPPEAANLHAALRDAESGRAQAQKGDSLDIVVQETAPDLDLQEGEVLKLPPTPDQTDGHEHESDPETERVHRASYPGSHNVSRIPSPAPGQGQRLVPPPLPSRNPQRPNLQHHQHSSASYYSDAGQDAGAAAVVDSPTSIRYDAPSGPPPPHLLPPSHGKSSSTAPPPPIEAGENDVRASDDAPPPSYELPTYAEQYADAGEGRGAIPSTSGYPAEKKRAGGGIIPHDALNEDGQPMSEAERREWEEFFASQGDAQTQAQGQDQAGPSANAHLRGETGEDLPNPFSSQGGEAVDELAQRLGDQHIGGSNGKGKGAEREAESLR